MSKISIKIALLTCFLFQYTLYAEIDLQKGMYDAADEMIRFDEKMNQAIAEHNQIDVNDEEQLHNMINDFEEREYDYLLEQEIPNSEHTKVEVKLENGLLTITTSNIEKKQLIEELNISNITTMTSTSTSLFIPNNANEYKMKKSYNNGILRITFPKK